MPVRVVEKLWLGSVHAAFNLEQLLALGVGHVLNVSGLPATFPKHFIYLTVELRDKNYANLLSCIPVANIFIEAALDQHGLLVHCAGGRSRSPALVIGYLMSSLKISYEEALAKVKGVRPVVKLNKGFEIQLRAYENANYDIFAAHQLILQNRLLQIARLRALGKSYSFLYSDHKARQKNSEKGRLRLTRPASPSVQVIPPLRSMTTNFCCRYCQTRLPFETSNIYQHHRIMNQNMDFFSLDELEEPVLDKGFSSNCSSAASSANSTPKTPPVVFFNNSSAVTASSTRPKKNCTTNLRLSLLKTTRTHSPEPCNNVGAISSPLYSPSITNTLLPTPIKKQSGKPPQIDESHMVRSCYLFPNSPSLVPSPNQNSSNSSNSSIGSSSKKQRNESGWEKRMSKFNQQKHEYQIEKMKKESKTEDEEKEEQDDDAKVEKKKIILPMQLPLKKKKNFYEDQVGMQAGGIERPCSAEKKRWLNSMKKLEKSGGNKSSEQILLTAEADEDELLKEVCDGCHCSVLFIEPMAWLGDLSSISGSLHCPSCSNVVGQWDWSGLDCNCGTHISPAFLIDTIAIQRQKPFLNPN